MELVRAGQHAEELSVLEVTHTHDTGGLVDGGAVDVSVVAIVRELLDVHLGETAWLGFPESLGQVEQGLVRG